MKISTWNLFSRNPKQLRAIDFLLTEDIDVMSFQELSHDAVLYLSRLKDQGFFFSWSVDHYADRTPFYNGILSRLPVEVAKSIPFQIKTKPTVSFNHFPRLVICKTCVSFLYHDYAISRGRKLRVFNTHLASRMPPRHRLRQLEEICALLTPGDNVICGDLNSFARLTLNMIAGPLCKFKLRDYRANELEMLGGFLTRFELKLGFDDKITYPFLRSLLDHILVPRDWSVKNVEIYKKRFGSDHRLAVLEV